MDNSNGSNSRSSSDSVDLTTMDGSPEYNGHMDTEQFSDEENGQPRLEIVEQPQQRGFRFRYECEGPSHGGLQGASSERFKKTVPTIRIKNYRGLARVQVSLVAEDSTKPHAHKLVGKNCSNGLCNIDTKPGTTQIPFPNLCIQHVTRRKAAEVLEQRLRESCMLQKKIQHNDFNYNATLTAEECERAKKEAVASAKNMQLNMVRLCYQAFLFEPTGLRELPAVISEPIFDSKAPGANALKICRMDKYSGCCTGGDEVFLLCEKVQRDDIKVKFMEQDFQGNVLWQADGLFSPLDVHRQFAIVFKTPEYKDLNIKSPVNVLVSLQRISDHECSDPKSFTYYPRSHDSEDIARKRQKILPRYHGGPRSPYDYNPPSAGSGGDSNSSGGSGGGVNGGLPNGGSIPHFNDLKHSAQQFKLPSGRDRRYARTPHSLNQYSQQSQVPLFPMADLLSNPTDFVYEEVSKMSPPNQPIDSMSPPLRYTHGSGMNVMGSHSPYNQMLSPQSAINGGMSPEHMQPSPQSMSALSPQGNLTSPINMADSSQASMQYGKGIFDGSSELAMQHLNQSMMSGGQAEAMMTNISMGTMHQIQQPIQASAIENMLMNQGMYCGNFDLQQQEQGYDHQSYMSGQIMKEMEQQMPNQYMPCSFVARGGEDEDLDDVMAIIDGGYDETDASLIKPPHGLSAQKPGSFVEKLMVTHSEAKDEELYERGSAPVTPSSPLRQMEPTVETKLKNIGLVLPHSPGGSVKMVEPRYEMKVSDKGESSKPASSGIGKMVEPNSGKKLEPRSEKQQLGLGEPLKKPTTAGPVPVVTGTTATSRNREKLVTKERAAQTDMDPMVKMAMKTSEALQYYAASGDIRSLLMVQRFLMAVQDQDGDLPLHTSLINLQYEVFQNILDVMVTLPDAYARINAYNFHHQTPLHLAVITNQSNAVDLLIRAGADTTLVDRLGYTPAHLAVLYNRIDCLKNLLKYLRPNMKPTEAFPELNIRCYNGYTPTHLAARSENLAAMKLLVHGKADVNMADGKSGQTPLHHAVENDGLSLAAYLILQAGANVNTPRFDGNTALHIACGRGNVGMVALLMAGGANPDIENDDVLEFSDTDLEEGTGVATEVAETKGDKEDGEEEEKDEDTTQSTRESVERPTRSLRSVSEVRRGLLPADYAEDNEKILRVLNGEPYAGVKSDTDHDRALQQTTDRLQSINLSSNLSSGIGSLHSAGGDMSKVEYTERIRLSDILDRDEGWMLLAQKLGYQKLFDSNMGNISPTRLLLNTFETAGGTVDRLVQALMEINRADCVHILKTPEVQSVSQVSTDKRHSKDPVYDSGVEESISKSSSPEHKL